MNMDRVVYRHFAIPHSLCCFFFLASILMDIKGIKYFLTRRRQCSTEEQRKNTHLQQQQPKLMSIMKIKCPYALRDKKTKLKDFGVQCAYVYDQHMLFVSLYGDHVNQTNKT